MARFEIVVTDVDRDTEDRPWNAGLWQMDEYGRSGDLLAAGDGLTALSALNAMLGEVAEQGGEAWRLLTEMPGGADG